MRQYEEDSMNRYDAIAISEAGKREKRTAFLGAVLPPMLSGFLKGTSVLDLGCGCGFYAGLFLDRGYRYTGVDISRGMLNQARKLNPTRASFVQMNMRSLAFQDQTFDSFVSTHSLNHISPDFVGEALEEIKRVMKPGARGLIILKGDTKTTVHLSEKAQRRFRSLFVRWEHGEFNKILTQHGFKGAIQQIKDDYLVAGVGV